MNDKPKDDKRSLIFLLAIGIFVLLGVGIPLFLNNYPLAFVFLIIGYIGLIPFYITQMRRSSGRILVFNIAMLIFLLDVFALLIVGFSPLEPKSDIRLAMLVVALVSIVVGLPLMLAIGAARQSPIRREQLDTAKSEPFSAAPLKADAARKDK